MKCLATVFVLSILFGHVGCTNGQDSFNWKNVQVLVYTRNGKGFVHDNIPAAISCIQQMGKKHGFKVDASTDATVMAEGNLKKYSLIVFASTNNDVFDTDAQRLAFRRYIEAGGGFVGIHSVMGTERNWKWFKMMLGGTFLWHPTFQKYKVRVINPAHPSMQGLPKVWEKEDECYFAKELYPGPTVLLAQDLSSLNISDTAQRNNIIKSAGMYAELYPAAWSYNYDGGHTWCTTLGHDKKDYIDPVFMQHIFQGIRYVAKEVRPLNYSKAYAETKDSPLQY